ncbi:hypothetical protein G9A89_009370 [Geosiphon pyriformis]|nr:hypothetical protein G9A89_009370 [Geosiphon pyriformis]
MYKTKRGSRATPRFPTYELLGDIGSGINFKRSGLETLLELTKRGMSYLHARKRSCLPLTRASEQRKATAARCKRQEMEALEVMDGLYEINVVWCSRHRHFYTENSHTGQSQQDWIKSQSIKYKLKLYTDVWAGKGTNEHEDKKLQKAAK